MASILDVKKIKIPIIQRDYVQGRGDEQAQEVLQSFLDTIFNTLKNKKRLHLDFIYGIREKEWFIPIDGQQRLTLLYLLLWYFAKKEQRALENVLSYETRVAAREFCKVLTTFAIDFAQESISEQIKNSKKFLPYWQYDPTISSMLKVLDEIHKRDDGSIGFDHICNITFEIFEMQDFDLLQAEELYRKMNARGKVLSSFENFKAIVQKIVFHRYPNLYKEIAKKFEGVWVDSFWKMQQSCSEVDELFMRFVFFITEMRSFTLGLKENVQSPLFWERFYSDKDNLDFLQNYLDKVEELKSKAQWIEKEIRFFEPKKESTLFDEVVYGYEDMSIANKLLAYLLFEAVVREWEEIAIEQLMRIARNYIHRIRALRNGRIDYEINLSYKEIKRHIDLFAQFFRSNENPLLPARLTPYEILQTATMDERMRQEQEKVVLMQKYDLHNEIMQLEEHPYLQGDLSLLLACSFKSKISWFYQHFHELFECETHLLARALLAVGEYAIWIGSALRGGKYFFGEEGKWEIVFTINEKNREKTAIFDKFFAALANHTLLQDGLQEIIARRLKEYEGVTKDWIYYFLKYPIILTPQKSYRNIFGWLNGYDDFGHIEKLESPKRVTNRRINVYLLALLDTLGVENVEEMVGIDEDDGMSFIDWPERHMQIWVEGEHIVVYNNEREYDEIALFAKEDAILQAKRIIDDL